jgi:peptide/nickel transport system permease protein
VQLLLLSVLAFIIIELPAGDFVDIYFDRLCASGVGVSREAEQEPRVSYGLDKPWLLRYLTWLRNIVFRFDFGYSFHCMVPVSKVVTGRMPLTFAIAFGSLPFTLAVGIPLGVYVTIGQYSVADIYSAPWALPG